MRPHRARRASAATSPGQGSCGIAAGRAGATSPASKVLAAGGHAPLPGQAVRPARDLAGAGGQPGTLLLASLAADAEARFPSSPTLAVVTCATNGIGRAAALDLARRGLHLVLVGRSPDKVARVRKEVRATEPSCEVRSVAFDLASTGDLATGADAASPSAGARPWLRCEGATEGIGGCF
nr:unnamed protein product [Digitaria exilis]